MYCPEVRLGLQTKEELNDVTPEYASVQSNGVPALTEGSFGFSGNEQRESFDPDKAKVVTENTEPKVIEGEAEVVTDEANDDESAEIIEEDESPTTLLDEVTAIVMKKLGCDGDTAVEVAAKWCGGRNFNMDARNAQGSDSEEWKDVVTKAKKAAKNSFNMYVPETVT